MKLKLTTNLGLLDAGRLDLDATAATEGATVDVAADAAEELIRRGWAVAASPAAKAPSPTKAADA